MSSAIHTSLKDNKGTAGKPIGIINSSLSNGSSYLSNSSTSSSVSSGNNLSLTEQNTSNLTNGSQTNTNKTVTMMMMMPLDKSTKPSDSTATTTTSTTASSLNNSFSSPPPKPNRLNANRLLADFSPTHNTAAVNSNIAICKTNNCFQKSANGSQFDEDISAIILNRDDVENKANNKNNNSNNSTNLLNLQSPTYSLTVLYAFLISDKIISIFIVCCVCFCNKNRTRKGFYFS